MRRWAIVLAWLVVMACVAGSYGCNGDWLGSGHTGPTPVPTPVPEPTPAPTPPPQVSPEVVWRGPDQVDILWPDITIVGGSEDYVLRWHFEWMLGRPRTIKHVQTFMGFDNGDQVEASIAVYDGENRVGYRRSEHLELVSENYDAWDTQHWLTGQPATRIVVDIIGRTTGLNHAGKLTSHQHYQLLLTFE